MNYFYYFLTGVFFLSLISLPGCSSSGRGGENPYAVSDTLTIAVSTSETDSITIIYTDNETLHVRLNSTESKELERLLRTASYDTDWNQSGIMVKMVAPDYSVVFHYRGKSQDDNDWLMIWKENDRAKFRNKWYLIPPESRENISRILENQRN